jgi:hypothetical protein
MNMAYRLLTFVLLFLCLFSHVRGVPAATLAAVSVVNTSTANLSIITTPDQIPRSLVKRHEYYLTCGTEPQDRRPVTPFVGQEDIKLARKCLGSSYPYICDAGRYKSDEPLQGFFKEGD